MPAGHCAQVLNVAVGLGKGFEPAMFGKAIIIELGDQFRFRSVPEAVHGDGLAGVLLGKDNVLDARIF